MFHVNWRLPAQCFPGIDHSPGAPHKDRIWSKYHYQLFGRLVVGHPIHLSIGKTIVTMMVRASKIVPILINRIYLKKKRGFILCKLRAALLAARRTSRHPMTIVFTLFIYFFFIFNGHTCQNRLIETIIRKPYYQLINREMFYFTRNKISVDRSLL